MTGPTRREILGGGIASLAAAACSREGKPMTATDQMPVLFQAHGAPPLLDDPGWIAELGAWAKVLPKPKAIVVLSAHWESRPLSIGAVKPLPLIYDFYGFPDKFYQLQYKSPGAPAVAQRIRDLCRNAGIVTTDEPERGLDHGVYIPLMCMYPDASIPVLQVSLPSENPAELFAVGGALAPLRQEGVLLIGSGFLTHNLRAIRLRETPQWANEFDQWIANVLVKRDWDQLLAYESKAPALQLALPTLEHFVPVIVAAGAAPEAKVTFPITGFWWGGAMTRRSAQFT